MEDEESIVSLYFNLFFSLEALNLSHSSEKSVGKGCSEIYGWLHELSGFLWRWAERRRQRTWLCVDLKFKFKKNKREKEEEEREMEIER